MKLLKPLIGCLLPIVIIICTGFFMKSIGKSIFKQLAEDNPEQMKTVMTVYNGILHEFEKNNIIADKSDYFAEIITASIKEKLAEQNIHLSEAETAKLQKESQKLIMTFGYYAFLKAKGYTDAETYNKTAAKSSGESNKEINESITKLAHEFMQNEEFQTALNSALKQIMDERQIQLPQQSDISAKAETKKTETKTEVTAATEQKKAETK